MSQMELRSGSGNPAKSLGSPPSTSADSSFGATEEKLSSLVFGISLKHSSDDFRVWKLRLRSYIHERKPSLQAALQHEATDERIGAPTAMQFAAVLMPWLENDILLEYSRSMDMELNGIATLRRLEAHFATTAPVEDSPEELLIAALRCRRDKFSTWHC